MRIFKTSVYFFILCSILGSCKKKELSCTDQKPTASIAFLSVPVPGNNISGCWRDTGNSGGGNVYGVFLSDDQNNHRISMYFYGGGEGTYPFGNLLSNGNPDARYGGTLSSGNLWYTYENGASITISEFRLEDSCMSGNYSFTARDESSNGYVFSGEFQSLRPQ
jgi:hypothetical protein